MKLDRESLIAAILAARNLEKLQQELREAMIADLVSGTQTVTQEQQV